MEGGSKPGPLYSIIYEQLLQAILEKRYDVGQKLPTEVELAKQFGVSRITSKRALEELERSGYIYRQRGRGSFVGEGPTKVGDTFALPQGAEPGKVVPMILPSQGHGMFGYVQGAADLLNRRGYYLQMYATNGTVPAERKLLLQLLRSETKALIYYPTDDRNLDVLFALHYNGHPIVTIDKHLESLPSVAVTSDNESGGELVTELLIHHGHRRIAYVSSVGLEAVSSVRDRFIGYCKALRDHNIPVDPTIVSFEFLAVNELNGSHRERGKELLETLLNAGVTAIQTEHDLVAREIMQSAQLMGLSLPDELSIVGFDNADLGAHLSVPLTTVEQNFYEVGRLAAHAAIQSLETPGLKTQNLVVVPVHLVSRSSVAAPSLTRQASHSPQL